jgi:hypothetical protein
MFDSSSQEAEVALLQMASGGISCALEFDMGGDTPLKSTLLMSTRDVGAPYRGALMERVLDSFPAQRDGSKGTPAMTHVAVTSRVRIPVKLEAVDAYDEAGQFSTMPQGIWIAPNATETIEIKAPASTVESVYNIGLSTGKFDQRTLGLEEGKVTLLIVNALDFEQQGLAALAVACRLGETGDGTTVHWDTVDAAGRPLAGRASIAVPVGGPRHWPLEVQLSIVRVTGEPVAAPWLRLGEYGQDIEAVISVDSKLLDRALAQSRPATIRQVRELLDNVPRQQEAAISLQGSQWLGIAEADARNRQSASLKISE